MHLKNLKIMIKFISILEFLSMQRNFPSSVSIGILKNLPEQRLKKIARFCQEVRLEPEELLFPEGAAGDSMFIIVSGQLQVWRGKTLIATRGPGEYLGEMSLIESKPRSATVKAQTHSTVLEISRVVFHSHLEIEPEILKDMLKTLSQRTREEVELISRQTQTLESHKNSISLLSRIIEETETEVILFDGHNLRINECNSQTQKLLGYTYEELSTMTLLHIFPEIPMSQFSDMLRPLNDLKTTREAFHGSACGKYGELPIKGWNIISLGSHAMGGYALYSGSAESYGTQGKFPHSTPNFSLPAVSEEVYIKVMGMNHLQNQLLAQALGNETQYQCEASNFSGEIIKHNSDEELFRLYLVDFLGIDHSQKETLKKRVLEKPENCIFVWEIPRWGHMLK